MFKSKHTFTCPDVIYLRKKAKKNQLIALAVQIGFFGSIFVAGKVSEARTDKELKDMIDEIPAETPAE